MPQLSSRSVDASPATRLRKGVLRLLFRLPEGVKRRIAGPAVRIDGRELALDAQLLIALNKRQGTVRLVVGDSPDKTREAVRSHQHILAGPHYGTVIDRDIQIDTPDGEILATLHTPAGYPAPSPLLVFFHGGGWVIGSRAEYAPLTRFLAHHAGVRVLSVDYRLAPEHPFPAPFNDALAAFEHAHAHAAELGVDPQRIAVGGDSAGGNLAAAVSQAVMKRQGPRPSHQFLFYPATDLTRRYPSRERLANGFMLTDDDIKWFENHYAPASADRSDPRLSPLLGEASPGIAAAHVFVAGFDPLRDEGEAYATALEKAGATVTLDRMDDLIHGYLNFYALGPRFRAAALRAAEAIRTHLSERN
ncbi:alpha/beta hydrolase [Streptomyces sp. SCSIO 30461]|uniref:alpha/beta hydrolase n=1 Tax=Streptomyces sp. SCSIO 30461 TaxID=3118085 RepID=UPI0030CA9720